ncbi:MAG TPA: Gfo/Idh/MocA family oxidoreductase [Tepidisphaeraceae bacterium]|nr:Gfo/Idh/MocA family oxidoreductase [Tepidisphaeraceae bacterium]
MDQVRWGIIGCGDVTEVKSGPALQKATGSALVAVMRRDAGKAADYARRHGVPRWYADARQLVDDPAVNAVYVATPPASHEQYALLAAAAGKAVYVEKPMSVDAASCRRMIDACAAAGVPLFVAYYRRCLPRFVQVKRWIDDGAVGAVRAVTVAHHRPPGGSEADASAWRVDPAVAGGGVFVDLASHTLDLLDHLLGPIASASGAAVNLAGLYRPEDTVAAHFTFAGGAVGSGLWCFCTGGERDEVSIVGDAGRITFATLAEHPVVLERVGREVERLSVPHPPHVQQPLIQTVVDALRGTGACPSTGSSAMRTNEVIDAILSGYRQASSMQQ